LLAGDAKHRPVAKREGINKSANGVVDPLPDPPPFRGRAEQAAHRQPDTANSGKPHSYPGIVPKRDRTLTFSATIRRDVNQMKTITVITILALLTISGAVVSDQVLTSQDLANQQQTVAARF
jgi:hypothetical protein